MSRILFAILFVLLGTRSAGADEAPVGRWKFLDPQGQVGAVIETWLEHGSLKGRIAELPQAKDPIFSCARCPEGLRNRPLIGLTILWGLKPRGGEWDGGTILDPMRGGTYACTAKTTDGGNKLLVHGFVGNPMFGLTLTWLREE